jgi:short-subunit dehydrogenase
MIWPRGTQVRVLSVDLSEPDALERTRTATDDVEIGLLIYNAGAHSVRGDFVDLDPAVHRSVIAVNVLGRPARAGQARRPRRPCRQPLRAESRFRSSAA